MQPSSTRRRVPRAEREGQMLDVALPLFAGRGYHAVSVDEVAAGAGVTKPLVYAYFGSKEGLFVACAQRAADRLMADLERSAAHHQDAEERMWHGLVTVFRFIAEHREAWSVLYGDAAPAGAAFAGPARQASEAMARLIADEMVDTARSLGLPGAAEQAEPIAHAFVAGTIGLGTWWLDHPEEPAELQAMRMMNLAWTGIRSVLGGELWTPPPPGSGR